MPGVDYRCVGLLAMDCAGGEWDLVPVVWPGALRRRVWYGFSGRIPGGSALRAVPVVRR